MDLITHYASPFGGMTIASNGAELTGLWFDGQRFFAGGLSPDRKESRLTVFDETIRWLDTYFSGRDPDFTPPLAPQGSDFRQKVWKILLRIPYGKVMTYGRIAQLIAESTGLPRMSAQAVGGAVGHNPVSLIIPCHRVIGADGSLTGYAGGIELKRQLLTLEKADLSAPFVPES